MREHVINFLKRFGKQVRDSGKEMCDEPNLYQFTWSRK